MSDAFEILGQPEHAEVLIIADHASNTVPPDIALGIDAALLRDHIAVDIGVAEVARLLCQQPRFAGILGGVSRLVVDLNRDRDEDAVLPTVSDTIAIPGNITDGAARESRLATYFDPYHQAIADLLDRHRPAFILSLHSFTPYLRSDPSVDRPWQIGVLYNADERVARLALAQLRAAGLNVGDQLPYSGKDLNATMNRHAEGRDIPYTGIEIRQDQIAEPMGQAIYAQILLDMSEAILKSLSERQGTAE